MKKPIFNEFERQIIHENNSLNASVKKVYFTVKKIERSFMKSSLGRLLETIADWLCKPLNL